MQAAERPCMHRLLATAVAAAFLGLTVPANAQDKPLTFDDGKALVRATLMLSNPSTGRIFVKKNSAAQMPAFEPLAYYAGNDKSGHPIIWMNENPVGTYVGETFASMAGAAFAAMDHGYAGPAWKARYDAATVADKALPPGSADPFEHRHALLTQLDDIFKARSTSQEESAKSGIAWATSTLRPGMMRSRVYALLKQRGLVAFNTAYNPGTPLGTNGCSFDDPKLGLWPTMDEQLPRRVGPCAMFGQPEQKKSPEAYISWDAGFTVACSTSTTLELDFDNTDKLMSLKKPDSQQSCY